MDAKMSKQNKTWNSHFDFPIENNNLLKSKRSNSRLHFNITNNLLKCKRSQVTIFIVIALIIVVAIALIFVIQREPIRGVSPETDPEAYIEKCIRDATEEAISILSEQGGDIEPEGSVMYKGKEITYLCYNANFYLPCINQRPMLIEHIEGEITDYIEPKVQECFTSLQQELEKRNYQVSLGSMNISTELQIKRVIVTINRELTITKNQETRNFEKLEAQVSSPIYDLAEIGNEIASQEAKYCYFNVNGFNSNYHDFEVRKDMTDDSKIYAVKELTSGKEFKFATRGCVMPRGL